MTLTVIGTGFVGVVTAGVLASFGHTVYGLDVDEKKIKHLQNGKVPFFEPKLDDLVASELKTGNLHFTTSYADAISKSDVIFISVGTPSAPDGQADLKYVFASVESLAPHLKDEAIVVIKSTVPPGTNDKVKEKIEALTKKKFYVASLPEFLREGSAVDDTFHPDRVVIGAHEKKVIDILSKLHEPLNAPIIAMSPESAQMTKYSANSYLATRITFINQIADLCEQNGADVMEVIKGIGADERIGSHYWYPGLGYGGSCFPKDVKELAAYSRSVGKPDNLLNRINEFNENRVFLLLDQYEELTKGWEGKTVAVLGLSFKPNTDDTRESAAIALMQILKEKGADVHVYDPIAVFHPALHGFEVAVGESPYHIAQGAHAVILATEWSMFTDLDLKRIKQVMADDVLVDARNFFEPQRVKEVGFRYLRVGNK
jgi:UDPglucose 6-dehydrogenase